MPPLKTLVLYLAMILWGLGGVGCVPPGGSGQDEQDDPDFRVGMNRKQAGNHARAIESFERALHRNPQSAAAHFELGLIYYQNVTNYVAAIYHFDRVQRLQPGFRRIDVVRQLMNRCKQEMVQDAMGGFTAKMQQEMERLERALRENEALRQEVAQLRSQLSEREPVLMTRNAAVTEHAVAVRAPDQGVGDRAQPAVARAQTLPMPSTPGSTTHIVRSGDTLYSIALRHGLTEAALRAANPGVIPTRMSEGQVIRVPVR